ncbi:pantoate--beta-alanine ligase [Thiorhodococcus mannitoliphagus]|uniref:Pantothenate synthetase n=1 Tax=Thiorhodococcus mannitoliphagus TaxID=329406 RepID=A0A6P1E0E4_9GAMM|nr:pantoate--beta-alanine ligase [Thiorhodococcus mannitoliphagus]NEX21912.1 pantoate--beta-alanine ligase [Thiorhodococcus mannitoliphagus]
MNRVERVAALRARVAPWRAAAERVALVPTMGNLHRGHLTLVREARARADRVVVSIFVNPLQFGPSEDLDAYPRTLEEDMRQLEAEGCDLLFTPTSDVVYPRGQDGQTRVEVPGLSDLLCGASRPGHFAGVATVVCKLLNMVQPDVALFGEKDFQQLMVIRCMVEDLDMPVEVVGVPIVREADGLAMSSRNGYLTPTERERAPALYRVLTEAAGALQAGDAVEAVETAARVRLSEAGLRPDYVSIRSAADLSQPCRADDRLVILAAAYLGRARLIDNLQLRRASG